MEVRLRTEVGEAYGRREERGRGEGGEEGIQTAAILTFYIFFVPSLSHFYFCVRFHCQSKALYLKCKLKTGSDAHELKVIKSFQGVGTESGKGKGKGWGRRGERGRKNEVIGKDEEKREKENRMRVKGGRERGKRIGRNDRREVGRRKVEEVRKGRRGGRGGGNVIERGCGGKGMGKERKEGNEI